MAIWAIANLFKDNKHYGYRLIDTDGLNTLDLCDEDLLRKYRAKEKVVNQSEYVRIYDTKAGVYNNRNFPIVDISDGGIGKMVDCEHAVFELLTSEDNLIHENEFQEINVVCNALGEIKVVDGEELNDACEEGALQLVNVEYTNVVPVVGMTELLSYVSTESIANYAKRSIVLGAGRLAIVDSLEYESGATLIGWVGECPEHIVVPDFVARIKQWTFNSTVGTKSLKAGKGLKEIGSFAFYSIPEMEVRLGDSIEVIGSFAFGSTNIKGKLTIPKSVRSIHFSTFANSFIEHLIVENGVITDEPSSCEWLGHVKCEKITISKQDAIKTLKYFSTCIMDSPTGTAGVSNLFKSVWVELKDSGNGEKKVEFVRRIGGELILNEGAVSIEDIRKALGYLVLDTENIEGKVELA